LEQGGSGSFHDKGVPKLELGNEKKQKLHMVFGIHFNALFRRLPAWIETITFGFVA
jgi:hypothetical protein